MYDYRALKSEHKVYGEKKRGITVQLTPTVIEELGLIADLEGCSRSEVIERVIRRLYRLKPINERF